MSRCIQGCFSVIYCFHRVEESNICTVFDVLSGSTGATREDACSSISRIG